MSACLHQPYAAVTAYVTRDGSEIRELMHPAVQGNRAQSLAEAIVQPGARTLRHRHHCSEEIYHVTAGRGRMQLGEAWLALAPGDTVCIPPGTPHWVVAADEAPLHLLCCCAPAYAHEDTELLE
ncbi:MAG: hypothetical protein RIR00_2207 [Pseudomonadota bacterium]|jgi:mannose-6-phosphate isomerase-like protein (cupin superfamily)